MVQPGPEGPPPQKPEEPSPSPVSPKIEPVEPRPPTPIELGIPSLTPDRRKKIHTEAAQLGQAPPLTLEEMRRLEQAGIDSGLIPQQKPPKTFSLWDPRTWF